MSDRDEYVAKLKAQLDEWNGQIALWEAKAKAAQAGMKDEYEAHLARLRAQHDEALDHMRRMQNASADAWSEMMRGTEAAWKALGDAFARARSKFEK